MFLNKRNTKKIMPSLALSCILLFNAVTTKAKVEYTQLGKNIALAYGTYLLGSIAHEFGHWLVGKIIHKCNGFFYIKPDGSGGTLLYYNPTKEVIKALWNDNQDYILKQPTSFHPSVYAAGPLFGISINLFVLILNTFYHEYKKDRLTVNAFKRTMQQPYINDKQHFGILCGTLLSLAKNICDFSPFNNQSDGNKILECFDMHCPTNKLADNALRFPISGYIGYILGWQFGFRYLQ